MAPRTGSQRSNPATGEVNGTGNSRNGYSAKRLTQMDEQILTLYAKGLSTRDLVETFKEMYDAYSALETGIKSFYY